MRPPGIRPGFAYRRPVHDLSATLAVSVLLAAIVLAGLAALMSGGGA